MEQAEILSFAAELFRGKIDQDGDGIDMDDIQTAMTSLFGDDSNSLAIGSLLSSMNMGSLMDIASSWLGDGENEAISSSQVNELIDSDKLSSFASQLGISKASALNGLTEALPGLIDKSSSGGSLLDSVGGIDGVMSMAKKLFS